MQKARPATDAAEQTWNYPHPSSGMGLYVHVPFCETKCPYCDFNTYSGIEKLIPSYMPALRAEITAWGGALASPPLESIFFGGGTPSYLPEAEIPATMDSIRQSFALNPDAEVTIECNPGDVTQDKLAAWVGSGVNRLSLGIQSFDDELLTTLGRRHNTAGARDAYLLARSSGIPNASLDLMYGLPGQSVSQWRDTLEHALELEPPHISLYSLQVEPGTPFDRDVQTGRLTVPDDDSAADMYEHAMERLESAGLRHYEISNWALPGRESRHNLMYWRNRPYLGVGPGAHSSLFGHRFANMKSPRGYTARMQRLGDAPAGSEVIDWMRQHGAVDFHEVTTRELAMSETMMMGLRLAEGVSDERFREMFGVGIGERYANVIGGLEEIGLLEWRNGSLCLTRRGRPLGNEVFSRFVTPPLSATDS